MTTSTPVKSKKTNSPLGSSMLNPSTFASGSSFFSSLTSGGSGSSNGGSSPDPNSFSSLWKSFSNSYVKHTPTLTKLIDSYLLFTVLSGIILFIYALLTNSYSYHYFYGGLASCLGSFVFAFNLRIHSIESNTAPMNTSSTAMSSSSSSVANNTNVNVTSSSNKNCTTAERAIAQFLFCHIFLFFVIANYIG